MSTVISNGITVKVPENLTWESLEKRYPNMTIVVDKKPVHIDALPEAIADGTLLKEFEEAADNMGVELDALLRRFKMNLSSTKTNARKAADTPDKTKTLKRVELLENFAAEARGSIKKATGRKSYWEWSVDEVLAVPLENVSLLKSIRDNKASKQCNHLDDLPDWFDESYVTACRRYSEANALQKNGTKQVELDAAGLALVQKLKDGGNMSKKDKAALVDLLGQLGIK